MAGLLARVGFEMGSAGSGSLCCLAKGPAVPWLGIWHPSSAELWAAVWVHPSWALGTGGVRLCVLRGWGLVELSVHARAMRVVAMRVVSQLPHGWARCPGQLARMGGVGRLPFGWLPSDDSSVA